MLTARGTASYGLGHTHLFQGATSIDKSGPTQPMSTLPSTRIKTALEQLPTRELPYKQSDTSWISNNLRRVGGPYTPLTTLDESTGRGQGLHRTRGWKHKGQRTVQAIPGGNLVQVGRVPSTAIWTKAHSTEDGNLRPKHP